MYKRNGPVRITKKTNKIYTSPTNKLAATTGLTWLEHSFNAFNGSGYANYDSPDDMIQSYIDYNMWKKRPEAAQLAKQYYAALLPLADHLITTSPGPGRLPSDKNWAKFQAFTSKTQPLL